MKHRPKLILLPILLLSSLCSISAAVPTIFLNRIEGTVYDPERRPLNGVRVELLNEVGSLLTGTKTQSGGRFSFVGVSSGKFLIKIIPVGLAYQEETTSVEVVNFARNGGSSSDTAYVEVVLRADKRANSLPTRPADAVFVQEVPAEARKHYEDARELLRKEPSNGIPELEAAVKIFPTYFDALSALGVVYIGKKDYSNAAAYLIRAIDVNQRSFSTYYNLAIAFYNLNQTEAGLAAIKAATLLAPTFVDAQILHGMLLKNKGDYKDAEAMLLKAESVAKVPVPEVHWQLALLYNKLNRNKEAAQQLETFLKIAPDSSDKKKVQDLIAKLKQANKS